MRWSDAAGLQRAEILDLSGPGMQKTVNTVLVLVGSPVGAVVQYRIDGAIDAFCQVQRREGVMRRYSRRGGGERIATGSVKPYASRRSERRSLRRALAGVREYLAGMVDLSILTAHATGLVPRQYG